jgi:EmrB/QacA subfamily drug resistance transporter
MNKENEKVSSKVLISIFAACLIVFCGLLTETAVNIVFPTLIKEFKIDTATVQWLTTGNLLVVAMITPLTAFFHKRFKLKNIFTCGAIIFLIGTILAVISPNFTMLLLARLIQGVAMGLCVPVGFSIILTQVPPSKTGAFMGIGALVTAAAPAVGPTFGGIINVAFGWRAIFAFLIPIIIIGILLGFLTISQVTPLEKVPTDAKGIFLVMITFFCLVYGFSNLEAIKTNLVGEIAFFIVGIIGLILFIRHCLKVNNPLVSMEIFKNRAFSAHLLAFFIINVSILGLAFILPNYLQITNRLNSMNAGMLMLPGAFLNAFMALVGGLMYDKLGAKKPIIMGAILFVVSISFLAIFGKNLSSAMIVVGYIIYGIGCGWSFGNTMTNGLKQLPRNLSADGNTAFNTLLQFSGAVGTSIVAAILGASQGSLSSSSYEIKTAIGADNGFIFLLILVVVCLIAQVIAFKYSENENDYLIDEKIAE